MTGSSHERESIPYTLARLHDSHPDPLTPEVEQVQPYPRQYFSRRATVKLVTSDVTMRGSGESRASRMITAAACGRWAENERARVGRREIIA